MVLPSVSLQMLLFLIRVADFSTDAVLRVGGLSAFKDAVIRKLMLHMARVVLFMCIIFLLLFVQMSLKWFLFPSENVKHEARLTGGARSMQDWGCVSDESFEVGAGQPLLSMRLFGLIESYFRPSCTPRKR